MQSRLDEPEPVFSFVNMGGVSPYPARESRRDCSHHRVIGDFEIGRRRGTALASDGEWFGGFGVH